VASQPPTSPLVPDYQTHKPQYHATDEDRAWLVRRLAYYALHPLLLLIIVYRIGPNLVLFHSMLSPGPADYVSYARQYAPMIAGIKAYQRDNGKLPADSDEVPAKYLPPNFTCDIGEIGEATSITFPAGAYNVIEYEFSPPHEGWIIHSPRYDGRIPAPIVEAAPAPIAPTTVPSNAN
jgi:hypothetical protein